MSRLRRFFKLCLVGLMAGLLLQAIGCGGGTVSEQPMRLTIGLVSYDDGASSLEKYERFQTYLAEQLKAVVELEPVFNEIRAVEQVRAANWSLVFAPSGLAAIAIAEANYLPIFPTLGTPNQKSVLVVRDDSPFQTLGDLANEAIALGEPGSATGYYLPLYDLYGLTLEKVEFASAPATALEWVADGQVAAGALSEDDFQQYRRGFEDGAFRILHASRAVPPGAVLISPRVDRNQQQYIEQAMQNAPPAMTADAGYIPNASPPDLSQLIALVEKVRPLEARVKEQPAVLTIAPAASPE